MPGLKKQKLTQKRLKELLDYDPKTGDFIWKVRTTNSIEIGDIAGSFSHGYIQIGIYGVLYLAHRIAWLYEYGYFPENGLDHKDRIRHHNWIDNLREASQQCNLRNTGNRKNNTSGVKGVCWDKDRNKWVARIVVNGKQSNLGGYKDFNNAVCARLAAEQCLGWSVCDSSSSAFKFVRTNQVFNI